VQRTALSADKIVPILKAGIDPSALLIYNCAAADAQAVRRLISYKVRFILTI
jgi:hypothetical protein